ncbi:right-handed parallel beta-helix repeat-containing protein, partial [Candidatus Saccharibacteria bacterium]
NVTIADSNWMGVNPTYTDNLTFDSVDIHGMNQWGEFSYSPQSGAIKTSRTQHTKVLNSRIADNKSHGLWFDQSNYDVQVAGNTITGNLGSSVFFEISDDLTLANNYIVSPANGDRAVKLAGSSGLKLINNTIIGGSDPVGIYTDSRSKPGCADPSQPLCANSYGSDRDTVHPRMATMDWVPRLDMMINNIIAYPKSAGYCGTTTAVCITLRNGSADVPLNTVIHQADGTRPKTIISGNVYVNGNGTIISTPNGKYPTPGAFAGAMIGAPVNIGGLEAGSWYGSTYVETDGSPTAALTALSSEATAVPADATINQYLSAGTRHYGVLAK